MLTGSLSNTCTTTSINHHYTLNTVGAPIGNNRINILPTCSLGRQFAQCRSRHASATTVYSLARYSRTRAGARSSVAPPPSSPSSNV